MTATGFSRPCSLGSAALFTLAILICTRALAAGSSDSSLQPETVSSALEINSEHLIELYHSVPGLKIIDSRHPQDHALGYIETSDNLPLAQTSCISLAELSVEKNQPIVFYSFAGKTSMKAIQIAGDCGYQRLFWFKGGFFEWEDRDYPYVIE